MASVDMNNVRCLSRVHVAGVVRVYLDGAVVAVCAAAPIHTPLPEYSCEDAAIEALVTSICFSNDNNIGLSKL